ncbi:MAG: 2-oxo acid dehydrogenase subunit E2 [Proteobacteria bacterium]|nr:2-oxo acid dehydrogenase subunit E2 [Pseudomonadota bacterium]MBU1451686.1 2-oxo acid dehydrogenase subunit E2 [Pseudomonadota bacterium]MBU2468826.1 2-oxo acid dehydrogenase subunit E2 [Pseudomonadota bacterium]MBU2518787.1 2-oxo acid dehydrogenase subunit E2 [Pseudomonadota bacterium]
MQANSKSQVRAMPAARFLARQKGLELAAVQGSGPGGIILKRDVAAHQAAPMAAETSGPARVTSLARKLALQKGVDLGAVRGSGPRGRVTKADVLRAAAAPAPAGGALAGRKVAATSMRKTIARRLSASAFTAPHIYFFSDVKMDALLGLYQDIKQEILGRHGVKISVNDLLIKAVALTLEEFPNVNASFDGENIEVWADINVGLAVALEEGLIVPAIASANIASLWEIASQRADLVERARERKLQADEIQRGTFTISSLAQYEITHFTAIINPPQSAILSVGKTQEKVVAENGQVVVRQVATLGLSVDHRIIDGAVAAQFLTSLKKKLERPALIFMDLG